jgi:hypothetical protein
MEIFVYAFAIKAAPKVLRELRKILELFLANKGKSKK